MTNRRCSRCKYFNRYYTKEIKAFQKTNFGWCSCARENVTNDFVCERYCMKLPAKRYSSILKFDLNGLLTELSEIRKLIEAESREYEDV